MSTDAITRSYGRCVLSEGFFDDFYDLLLSKSEAIKRKFETVDLQKQKALLKHGLSYMIMLSKGSPMALSKMESLGQSHARDQLNIEPWMYEHWKESLLSCVQKHDPKWQNEFLKEWTTAIDKGIELIKAKY